MAHVTILSGSFPAQKANVAAHQLTVKTSDGGQRIYAMKYAIQSLTTVSEHKGSVVFDLEFTDGSDMRAEADKKIVHQWTKYVGNPATTTYAVKEKTPQEVQQQNLIAGIILVVLFVFFLYQCSGDSTPSEKSPPSEDYLKISAATHCEQLVKNMLKAPKTADFPWNAGAMVVGNRYVVNSYVDAQNSFGAMLRNHYRCELELQGEESWRLVDFKMDD